MGDRAQVKIKMGDNPDLYLYTHWGGSGLIEYVRTALTKRWRWDDEEYLARIVFDEMAGGQHDEETGLGISTFLHGDNEHPLITLDCDKQEITIEDKTLTFENFLIEE